MNCLDFAVKLKLDTIIKTEKEIDAQGVFIGDLLSIVMAKAKQGYVWITIQTHINIIAVAELLELSCIIIVENMDIDSDTIKKAEELHIPIYKTKESAYEVACRLNSMGIK